MARTARFALLLLLAALLDCRADEPDSPAASDAPDLDLDDEEDDEASMEGDVNSGGAAPEGPPVDDFDLDLPEAERKTRMRACFAFTVSRTQSRSAELEEMVKQAEDMMQGNPDGDVQRERVINSIVFSWMMTCYMNIDSDGVRKASKGPLAEEDEQMLFAPPQTGGQSVHQASKRQWQLLEGVLLESQQAQEQRQQAMGDGPRGYSQDGPLGAGMTGQTQALYMFCVFGLIFGVGAVVVLRLSRPRRESADNDKTAKAQKKMEKAEKKTLKEGQVRRGRR